MIRRRGRTTFATALGAVLAFSAGLAGCGESTRTPAKVPETVRGVGVAVVELETLPDEIEAPGTVESVATAEVAARMTGTVTRVAVREGDFVRRGQLLVQLDDREVAARRSAAHAALEEAAAAGEEAARGVAAAEAHAGVAAKTMERFTHLRKEASVSPQEFDEVEAKHKAAQAAQAGAKARQKQVEAMKVRAASEAAAAEAVASYARVVAPFDGVVVRRSVEPGAMAALGVPLVVLEAATRYRMEVTLPAAGTPPRRGSRARVRLDALAGKELEGSVVEVEAGADRASQTVRARIDLPREAGLRSGLFGRAWFRRGERKALVVPRRALVERGQLRGVYVVERDAVARLRLITLGDTRGERVEVLSGLSAGERIVADPGGQALEGRRVEEQP